jgi:uncharacterized protein YggE
MITPAFRKLLTAVALAAALPTSAALAQQPTGSASGIWIAGPDGRLRSVQPVRTPLQVATATTSSRAAGVRIVFEVEHHARSAAGAVSGSELAVARIASALSAFGVSPSDIAAEPAFVQPRRERRLLAASWEQPRISHYEAGHLVTVTIRDSRRVGLLIDRAIGAGATRVVAMEGEGR